MWVYIFTKKNFISDVPNFEKMLDVSLEHSFKILNQVSLVIIKLCHFTPTNFSSIKGKCHIKQSLPAFSKKCSGKQFYMFKL